MNNSTNPHVAQWLDPTIHLIPENQTVLACFNGKNGLYVRCIEKSSRSGKYWKLAPINDQYVYDPDDFEVHLDFILYWMPLPKPPNNL